LTVAPSELDSRHVETTSPHAMPAAGVPLNQEGHEIGVNRTSLSAGTQEEVVDFSMVSSSIVTDFTQTL